MVQMLVSVVAWLRMLNGCKAIRSDVHRGFRLFIDSTLMNPERPYETCSAEYLKRFREASGIEPATRTVVHSCRAGHSVQVLLLKTSGQLDA
jgi:hypothetical protein